MVKVNKVQHILLEDLGMKYPTENSKRKSRFGLYKCGYCGRVWETYINKYINSCGCLIGKASKHGLESNRFYSTWSNMNRRCNTKQDKNYKDYGGRGIKVCEEWLDIKNFISWAESTHPNIKGVSLDRIDNDRGYSPDNCRWADKTIQTINQGFKKSNTSGFVGVSFNKDSLKWRASIRFKHKIVHLGRFISIEEAVEARDNYIIEHNLPHKLSSEYKKEK